MHISVIRRYQAAQQLVSACRRDTTKTYTGHIIHTWDAPTSSVRYPYYKVKLACTDGKNRVFYQDELSTIAFRATPQ